MESSDKIKTKSMPYCVDGHRHCHRILGSCRSSRVRVVASTVWFIHYTQLQNELVFTLHDFLKTMSHLPDQPILLSCSSLLQYKTTDKQKKNLLPVFYLRQGRIYILTLNDKVDCLSFRIISFSSI